MFCGSNWNFYLFDDEKLNLLDVGKQCDNLHIKFGGYNS